MDNLKFPEYQVEPVKIIRPPFEVKAEVPKHRRSPQCGGGSVICGPRRAVKVVNGPDEGDLNMVLRELARGRSLRGRRRAKFARIQKPFYFEEIEA